MARTKVDKGIRQGRATQGTLGLMAADTLACLPGMLMLSLFLPAWVITLLAATALVALLLVQGSEVWR